MRPAVLMIAALSLSGAALAQSGSEVRRVRPVPVPAELADSYRPGDRWAWLELDVDRRGHVSDCRVLQSNEASRQRRYYMCRAFLLDYQVEPLRENGVAVPGKIRRVFLLRGPNHRREERRTRNPN